MLKKTVTYTDYDGTERTEDFYFNFSKSELMEMELSVDGGLKNRLERIIKANDQVQIMKEFKDIIIKSYGEKSADGKRFIKSPELSEAFMQTGAYDQIFMEICTNEKAAVEFVDAIMPEFKA